MWEGLGGPIRMDQPDFSGIDPTLEDCCRREAEDNRRRNVLEASLRRHDVVAMAERRRRHLVSNAYFQGCRCGYDPERDGGEYRTLIEYRQQQNEKQQQQQQQQEEESNQHNNDNNDKDDDNRDARLTQLRDATPPSFGQNNDAKAEDDDEEEDEYDYLLEEDLPETLDLEDRRRAELELAVLHHETARQHGYGVHRQIHPTRVLKAAGLLTSASKRSHIIPPPPAVVLHLVDPESWASASLDWYLEQQVAPTSLGGGTKFLRSGGRATLLLDAETVNQIEGGLLGRLDPDQDMPALVAIRDGVVVNVCPRLQGLTEDNDQNQRVIVPDAVEAWLDRSGVLLAQPPSLEHLCAIRPEEEALLDNMMMMKKNSKPAQEEMFYLCGVPGCRKTFRHEHVGIQTEEQEGHVVSKDEVLGATDNSNN